MPRDKIIRTLNRFKNSSRYNNQEYARINIPHKWIELLGWEDARFVEISVVDDHVVIKRINLQDGIEPITHVKQS